MVDQQGIRLEVYVPKLQAHPFALSSHFLPIMQACVSKYASCKDCAKAQPAWQRWQRISATLTRKGHEMDFVARRLLALLLHLVDHWIDKHLHLYSSNSQLAKYYSACRYVAENKAFVERGREFSCSIASDRRHSIPILGRPPFRARRDLSLYNFCLVMRRVQCE